MKMDNGIGGVFMGLMKALLFMPLMFLGKSLGGLFSGFTGLFSSGNDEAEDKPENIGGKFNKSGARRKRNGPMPAAAKWSIPFLLSSVFGMAAAPAQPERRVDHSAEHAQAEPRISGTDPSEPAVAHRKTGRFVNELSSSMQVYVKKLKGVEGNTKNPTSSASGEYQFLDSTWVSTVRKYAKDYPDRDYHKLSDPSQISDKQILSLKKYNDDFKDYVFIRMTQANANSFRARTGVDPSPGWLYMCHQQGTETAIQYFENPNARAIDILQKVHGGGTSLDPSDTRRYSEYSDEEKKRMTRADKCLLLNAGTASMSVAQIAGRFTKKFPASFDGPAAGGNMAVASRGASPATSAPA